MQRPEPLKTARRQRSVLRDLIAVVERRALGLMSYRGLASPDRAASLSYVPGLVLAEVDYFLRDEREAMQSFMQDVARGAFTYAPPTLGQLVRAMSVHRPFADLRLGLVDASVVVLAESLGVYRLATRDVRHFAAVRLASGRTLDLIVHPTDPHRS